MINAITNIQYSFVAPFVKLNDFVQELANLQVACNFESMSTQFNLRLNTTSGLGDLIYTILYAPIEGFFLGQFDPTIDNKIWHATYNLYQGLYQRQSMTCLEAGF